MILPSPTDPRTHTILPMACVGRAHGTHYRVLVYGLRRLGRESPGPELPARRRGCAG